MSQTTQTLQPVCDILYAYVKKAEGFRINAGHDYAAFKEMLKRDHPAEAALLARSAIKVKDLCDLFPELLVWVADAKAPGCGYIGTVKKSYKKPQAQAPTQTHAQTHAAGHSSTVALPSGAKAAALTSTGHVFSGLSGAAGDALSKALSQLSVGQKGGGSSKVTVSVSLEISVAPYGAHAGRQYISYVVFNTK